MNNSQRNDLENDIQADYTRGEHSHTANSNIPPSALKAFLFLARLRLKVLLALGVHSFELPSAPPQKDKKLLAAYLCGETINQIDQIGTNLEVIASNVASLLQKMSKH